MRRLARPSLALLSLGLALFLPGCLDPIVGAECQAGYEICDRACYDLQNDPSHCGSCDNACASGLFCVSGQCSEDPTCVDDPEDPRGCLDGGPGDGGIDGNDGDGGNDGGIDGGIDAATDGGIDAGDVDADPNAVDAGPDADPGMACDPLLECDGECVNPLTDPDNCGTCNNNCTSGLCVLGSCVGGAAGHVVIIGHDYFRPRGGMNRILGNAVFLNFEAFDPEVRVLAYRLRTTDVVVSGADSAINQVAAEAGRTWSKTFASNATEIIAGLPTADVLLIYSQNGALATDAELNQLGSDIAVAVNLFLANQGIVIVMDGVNAAHNGTYQVAQAAGIFTAGSRTTVTGETLDLVGPADTVGANVPLMYAAEQTSVSFDTSETVSVVEADSGQPVVIHRVIF